MLDLFISRVILLIREGLVLIFDFYFLWLPFFLGLIFWELWKNYVVLDALLETETKIFQIRLPREITKSPKAMELFLTNLYQTGGEGHFFKKWWKGGTRPWFSLEIVSIEGEIRFYIWTREKLAKVIENELYAQYPNIEIVETDDYTKRMKFDPETKGLFGSMFTKTKDDPYPIKTYIDYGLEEDPKEEFKVDPIASTIEFLGSIGKGQQVWIQVLIRAHKKFDEKGFFAELFEKIGKLFKSDKKEVKNWEEKGKEIVDELMKRNEEYREDDPKMKLFVQSKGEQKTIESVERAISKPAFDSAIRAIYIANKDDFNAGVIGELMNSFKQYTSSLNGFKPVGSKVTDFDAPWMDPTGGRVMKRRKKIFEKYVKRAQFATRYNIGDMVLNTEELATIFHFPSSTVETPTLPRIPSKKAEPPSNLPL